MKNKCEGLPEGLPYDPLDDALVSALRGREERVAGMDVAAEALARGQRYVAAEKAHAENLARLARLSKWTRRVTFAAAALIVVTVAVGYKFWPASTGTDSATETTSDLTSTATSIDFTTLGIALFMGTLVVVVLAMLFTPERPQMRLTPA
jgi:hypothetical protein